MAVNVKIKNLSKVEKETREVILKAMTSQQLRSELGESLIKAIKGATRLGRIPESGQPLKGLAPLTIKARLLLEKHNKTDSLYRADKSNLTFTGQLLNSLSKKVPPNQAKILVGPEGKRKPYLYKGKRIKNDITNEELGEILNKDRPFLTVSEKMLETLRRIFIRHLRRMLRKR